MAAPEAPTTATIPVNEYVRDPAGPVSHLAHGWELYSAVRLTPAEDRTMVREPARAVPGGLAERLGNLRVLIAPYVGCFDGGDAVCFTKPPGESHTAVWVDSESHTNLVLACRELDAHDTGFEFLASIAQMALARLTRGEMDAYERALDDELRRGVAGEIDKEALDAKAACLGRREASGAKSTKLKARYLEVSLSGTLAEYMHGLWHDVQIRVGPEYLPVPELRKRMTLLAELFPPNPGYNLFARELEHTGTDQV
ncbi:MAG: hypothetical protein ACRD3D_03175 [Terriglobia bacterium]